MQHVWWIWALGSLLALVLEAGFGGSFVFVFFALGAAVTAACCGLGLLEPIWQQALCFSGVSAVTLLVLRRSLTRWGLSQAFLPDRTGLNGSLATVEVAMPPGAIGRVLHRGTVWMARNGGPEPLAVGNVCQVSAVDNLTLVVALYGQGDIS